MICDVMELRAINSKEVKHGKRSESHLIMEKLLLRCLLSFISCRPVE